MAGPGGQGQGRGQGRGQVQAQVVYEAKPIVRDLRKEATTRALMPAAVREKLDASRGRGKLLEPEEMDRLEREGYAGALSTASTVGPSVGDGAGNRESRDGAAVHGNGGEGEGGNKEEERLRQLEEEEKRFRREVLAVTVEDVAEDDDDDR